LISHRLFDSRVLIRAAQLVLLCILIAVTTGATDSSARFDKDSHELICMCGCTELLGECNHVGCPDSPVMLAQLSAGIARGDSDNTIFHQFQEQYGPVVLAAPRFTRFNHLAWIMPPLVLFLGIGSVLLIVRNWKLRTVPMPAVPDTPGFAATRDRIRRETEI
jgi:cytochrome c-type biogenesis protein CcmH